MNDFKGLEAAIGGLYLSLLHAIGPERAERATDMLAGYIADSRTGNYERQLYADLLECIDQAVSQPLVLDFDCLATVH